MHSSGTSCRENTEPRLQMMLFEIDAVGWAKGALRRAHHPSAVSS
jgi:hypothetical protein